MSETQARRDATPYLSSLDGSASERVTAMEWGRHLGSAFGASGALNALQYYEEVGWISENVKRSMADYVRGLPIDALEPDPEHTIALRDELEALEGTPFEAHAKSLEYVAAIANDNITHQLATISSAAAAEEAAAGGASAAPSEGEFPAQAAPTQPGEVADDETEE